jgi:hypothetical protein
MPRIGIWNAEIIGAPDGEVIGPEAAVLERFEPTALNSREITVAGAQAFYCGQQRLMD